MKAPLAIFVGCVVVLGGLLANAKDAPRPNFVFFLVDDLGWKDLSCYGSEYHESPNIDAFASTAMRFTSGYAAASICSPTRASIVTGRHPVRVNVTDWIPGMKVEPKKNVRFLHLDDRDNLALEEVTIAEELKGHGYQTFFAGKWHLGSFYNDSSAYGGITSSPLTHGFDRMNATVEVAPTMTTNWQCTPEWDAHANFGHYGAPNHCAGGPNPGGPSLPDGCCFNYWWNDDQAEHGVTNYSEPVQPDDSKYLADSFIRFMESRNGKPFLAQISFHNCHVSSNRGKSSSYA